ncbi:MAG: amino acid ABC transporter ATP-binding protein [Oscillospiraceae bacterium]|jgi:L-cystine transport system ATP-binding protein|nr:amino acid ABC transporter ATP-binding protein [Oscillospiraceae bacterium]
MSDVLLELHGLRKSFGKSVILRGIDLDVRQGETVALLGPSGSGKTTLLRCLNALEKADAGRLRIEDLALDLHRARKKETLALRRKSAMVFQNYDLFLNKTVLQNVTEGLVIARNVPKEIAEKTALEALAQVGMAERRDARPHELSGGQQQRVGIARALALQPSVLLFDEPTSALDPERVQEILDLIKSVAVHSTLLIVTHEMAFAYEVADRVIFMDGGEIVEQGAPKEIFGHPQQERTRTFLARFTQDKTPEYFI